MAALSCRTCSASIPADDVDLPSGYAKCRACHAVFSFREPAATAGQELTRALVEKPERFRIDDEGLEARISWRWFTPAVLFMVVFCVCWNGFLVVWYAIALSQPITNKSGQPVGILPLVFPLLHVAVGVGITYATLAGLFNRTTLVANRDEIRVSHGPLPWRSARVATRDVKQLAVFRRETRSKNGVRVTYDLNAVTRDRKRHSLVTGLDQAAHAVFLEQHLERKLGIRDEPVDGELSRAPLLQTIDPFHALRAKFLNRG